MMRAFASMTLCLLLPVAAFGQASTNQQALDRLGPVARPHPHAARPVHHAATHARTRSKAHAQHRAQPVSTTAARIGKAPTIPLHPPPPPIIAPPAIHVDLHPPPPPPAIPVDAKAIGVASPIRNGMRITFGPSSAAVNADTDAALHGIAAMMKAEPNTVTDIDAFAPGSADDPSSPRRLSLARALTARAVLINAGIASTRIYARALGATAAPASDTEPEGLPNRLDIVMRNTDAPAATPVPVKAASR